MTEIEVEQIRRQVLRKHEVKGIGQGAKAINEILEASSKITAEMIVQCLQHSEQVTDEPPHKSET